MTADQGVDFTADKLLFLSEHIVYKSVCAPAAWTAEMVENVLYDSGQRPGTSGDRWVVTPLEHLPGDETANPIPCNDCKGRQHWLLNC